MRSTPATEMVASPTRTTPRFRRRSASSSRENSMSGSSLARLDGCGTLPLDGGAAESVWRPGPRDAQDIAARGPAPSELAGTLDEGRLPGPRDEQAGSGQRSVERR